MRASPAERAGGPALTEALWVWALLAAALVAVLVTYARLPPADLYNVSETGLTGGLSRALVFANFPLALVAIALVALPVDRLASRWADAVAVVAVALCVVVGFPGVVDENDLDAKWVNALPALGVVLVLALTAVALVRTGRGRAPRRVGGDRLRVALAVVIALASIPWIFAELGFYVSPVPVAGDVFLADEVVPEPEHPDIRAVHLGHHHGTDGALLALAALALTRVIGRVRRPRLRLAFAAWVSLMLVYGLANGLQDFWYEQLVKRGTTDAELPGMLQPGASASWLGIALASGALYALLTRPAIRLRRRVP